MNKKGFTLVELLVVIAILGIIVAIAVPSVNVITQKAKENEFKDKINLIETAAVFYAQEEITTFPATVTLDTLISNDYLKADVANGAGSCQNANGCLLNPTDNSVMSESINITKNPITNAITAQYGKS